MGAAERRARMRRLRRLLRRHDLYWWAESFLKAAITRDQAAFPQPMDHDHSARRA
jgi:trehalose-6-phosphate synthase